MNVQYKWKIKDKFNHRQYIHAKNTEYREELCIQLKRFMKKNCNISVYLKYVL